MIISRYHAGNYSEDQDEVYASYEPYTRYIEDIEKDDIIWRKKIIKKIFDDDPDLLELLGEITPIQHEKGESEERKQEVDDYNKRIKQPEIIPWLKINPTITNVQNCILFDFYTERLNYDNPNFMQQYLVCMIMIREEAMEYTDNQEEGEYLSRADVVAYIIKDLLNRTDALGMHLLLSMDEPKAVDGGFYCRELRFVIKQPSYINGQITNGNKYDKWN